MKVQTCPHCQKRLKVPDKLRDRVVTCPACDELFLPAEPDSAAASTGVPPNVPSQRGLPLPARLRPGAVVDVAEPAERDKEGAGATAPPRAARVAAPTRSRRAPRHDTGGLPTLQLEDEAAEVKQHRRLRSSPLFLGLLVCASLTSSALILWSARTNRSARSARTPEEIRELLRDSYASRSGELQPYQLELREAQLARSRGDREAETFWYRKVMRRFRAEDRNPYAGLTGSPSRDRQLEQLLALLLNEAAADSRGNATRHEGGR